MRWSEEEYAAHMARQKVEADRRRTKLPAALGPPLGARPPRAKFGNRKMQHDGILWDSELEGKRYLELKAKLARREISDLSWKVPFELKCPTSVGPPSLQTGIPLVVVAHYIADFVYIENGQQVVEDTKGVLTPMYRLKRKWLKLQTGIVIREVYARPRRRRVRKDRSEIAPMR